MAPINDRNVTEARFRGLREGLLSTLGEQAEVAVDQIGVFRQQSFNAGDIIVHEGKYILGLVEIAGDPDGRSLDMSTALAFAVPCRSIR